MRNRNVLRYGLILIEVLLALVTLMALIAFARTASQAILTNALILILIMVQVFMATVMIGGKK